MTAKAPANRIDSIPVYSVSSTTNSPNLALSMASVWSDIHGEIIEMGPQGWPHAVGKSKVADELRTAFAGMATVMEQTPHPTDDSDPEPDVRVFPGRYEDSHRPPLPRLCYWSKWPTQHSLKT